jgi:hypothetical protein
MKPTNSSPANRQQNFPPTDYNYQAPLQDSRATGTETRNTDMLRGFWTLSGDYLISNEARLSYGAELAFFSVIVALSASQIFWMLSALVRL